MYAYVCMRETRLEKGPSMDLKIPSVLLLCLAAMRLHAAEAAAYSRYWNDGVGREMLVATVDGQDYWITDD